MLHRGLSPLARGTLQEGRQKDQLTRFIPAGAGNTPERRIESDIPAVYPRWRGEHPNPVIACPTIRGLSPLARGTLAAGRHASALRRFIPAGAGNTFVFNSESMYCPVYPRWRGEHTPKIDDRSVHLGLSPLARGTPPPQWLCWICCRFIPAGAGNTVASGISITTYAVYPRWRGEHFARTVFLWWWRGLSPLARGTQLQIKTGKLQIRFIPAGAGNTSLSPCKD